MQAATAKTEGKQGASPPPIFNPRSRSRRSYPTSPCPAYTGRAARVPSSGSSFTTGAGWQAERCAPSTLPDQQTDYARPELSSRALFPRKTGWPRQSGFRRSLFHATLGMNTPRNLLSRRIHLGPLRDVCIAQIGSDEPVEGWKVLKLEIAVFAQRHDPRIA